MVKWRGLPTKDVDGCLYVKLDDVRELDEQLWQHLEARIDELDAELSEASNERKYEQIFGRISEIIDLKGYINQGWRRPK
jgi:MoxR-like ATPase